MEQSFISGTWFSGPMRMLISMMLEAIRDSGNVKEGDYVGISGKEILASAATPESALMALADAL